MLQIQKPDLQKVLTDKTQEELGEPAQDLR
jgi:hypothetical protein